jgi:hypothetical protein
MKNLEYILSYNKIRFAIHGSGNLIIYRGDFQLRYFVSPHYIDHTFYSNLLFTLKGPLNDLK